MTPIESLEAFNESVESRGEVLTELVARLGVAEMLSFYASREVSDCQGPSRDMLLFEWGTYNWGKGESFELSICRQFMELGEEGEPEVSQLRLVFKYVPTGSSHYLGKVVAGATHKNNFQNSEGMF